ncbi:MAG: flagellar motor switch protein FliN [Halothiobacillus sp. 14-56-357]|jgi:flagellar motor switch protein FliN/FliY|uniref:flagellar motor switch protein FliN n=1 Tax=Halothiobacillus sp. 15-55-196 TaxID=1970382 RepID=UPI000BC66954|nr:flagellar motor switch protein FliN [Halothiobacillus sp. 15-55-196]OZB37789.1 MAG: flagellar motor switch protein FliN [Halothiobacillus sp. 15-55-196]OZB57432.1 MAG: flagellar motor switch protein FliN [Halothiobacillus sp. 14-56-357]OZB78271.1 MAG: flagellar motor switch protein FliN [Halothiobacillus sp. 13-55-115]
MAENTEQTDDSMDDWAAAMAEQAEVESGENKSGGTVPPLDQFESAGKSNGKENPINLEVLMDVPVTLSMEIGRTSLNIRSLLQLNQGSIVELDRLAGEPLDVLVNGTLIARGEVVVINEKFGIRLTDVISPAERLRKLR